MKTNRLLIPILAALLMTLGSVPAVFAGPNEDLAAAEQSLRISKETLRQIEGDLRTIKADPTADQAVVKEFETYAQRSRAAVAQNQTKVDALKAAGAVVAAPPVPVRPSAPGRVARPTAPPPPQYQVAKPKIDMRKEIDQDPLARLDSLLGKSIADFDAKLLREMQTVEQGRRSGSTGIGAAGGRDREMAQNNQGQQGQQGQQGGQQGAAGQEGGQPGENGQGTEGRQAGNGQMGQQGQRPRGQQGQQGGQAGQPGGQQGEGIYQQGGQQAGNQQAGNMRGSQGQSRGGGASTGTSGSQTQTGNSRGGGTDDDIVARQLREAAERETDPVLKAKLWKEYESYKRGR